MVHRGFTILLYHYFSKKILQHGNTPPISIAVLSVPLSLEERGIFAVLLPCVSQYASHLYSSTFGKVLVLGITGIFPQDHFSTPNPQVCWFYFVNLVRKEKSLLRKPDLLTKGVKGLEIAVEQFFAPTRFSLVRISIRDLVADEKSLVRNSGVGGGGENLILIPHCFPTVRAAMGGFWNAKLTKAKLWAHLRGRSQGDRESPKRRFSQKTADFRRSTTSPENSSIWRAQETAENRRFSQKTAGKWSETIRTRAEYSFGEYGFKHRAQWVFLPSPSSGERTQWVPLSLLLVFQSELTEFSAEITEFAPKLSEAQWVLFSETVLSKDYSARFLTVWISE